MKKTEEKKWARRGSALLIVLGFLSFMMISAVSFAIYMRIERQASSNYRHSTTARHMLNAALYRAIDEIDSELRIPSISGVSTACKFPTNWPGRVKTSAVADGDYNGMNTRALSMESLGFIPGILVNDVRYYANSSAASNWRGAKWRTFRDIDGSRVGRYAYICVNVSDMLDVNLCRASGRDSNSNRVSISHLFETDAQRSSFDSAVVNTDWKYLTLQDFYACLDERGDTVFTSPYHEFADPKTSGSYPDKGFGEADNHVLITGSRVLPEPYSAATPPLNLQGLGPAGINNAFVQKLDTALPNVAIAGAGIDTVTKMITDYLDENSVPSALNIPTVEMTPMITQITFVPMGGANNVIANVQPDPADPTTMNVLTIGAPGAVPFGSVFVEVVWPFKNWQARKPLPDPNSFKVRVHAYVAVVTKNADAFHTTAEFNFPPLPASHYYPLAPVEATVTFPAGVETPDDRGNNINNFYAMGRVQLPNFQQAINLINSAGLAQSPFFGAGNFVSVATIIFAQVLDASGRVVDQAPAMFEQGSPAIPAMPDFVATPKLFFQTDRARIDPNPMSKTLAYKWDALETPDPRFNHKASNWVQWQAGSVSNDKQQPGHNRSTEQLLGQDGRDTDIFMAVADTGYFQSPGELGFIIRPFDFSPGGVPCDLSDLNRTAEDQPHMFRTIRIYDHGGNGPNQRRDNIYEHFIVKNPDDTLPGARVNPLSDIPSVLEAAIAKTPFNYWISARLSALAATPQNPEYKELQTETYDSYDAIDVSKRNKRTLFQRANWRSFVQAWRNFMVTEVQTRKINNRTIAASWQTQLRDVYGLFDTIGWHADTGDTMTIFKSGYAHNAEYPLHEIDRKMLYSFSLDSFCDRQQLFLYVIRAEVTSPSLFGSVTEARSLAGGRAVALVWRDPYPTGYNKDNDNWKMSDYDFDRTRISPWYQHNINRYDNRNDEDTSDDNTFGERRDSHHAHRVIFFKQLDK